MRSARRGQRGRRGPGRPSGGVGSPPTRGACRPRGGARRAAASTGLDLLRTPCARTARRPTSSSSATSPGASQCPPRGRRRPGIRETATATPFSRVERAAPGRLPGQEARQGGRLGRPTSLPTESPQTRGQAPGAGGRNRAALRRAGAGVVRGCCAAAGGSATISAAVPARAVRPPAQPPAAAPHVDRLAEAERVPTTSARGPPTGRGRWPIRRLAHPPEMAPYARG
jgi:hypothetical protein